MCKIFDSHAHYDDTAYDTDRDELLNKLFNDNVCGIINVGCDMKTSKSSIELAHKYSRIWASVGIHPSMANENIPKNINLLEKYLSDDKVVALGEIGLDYHVEGPSKEIQLSCFEEQLKLAKKCNLPVIIHSRDAQNDTLQLLKKYQPNGVIHCFSGSVEIANEVLKLGMYIGLGGAVTFKNAKNPVIVSKIIPIERLLLETDCPYMAPVPHRGKRCDSSMILNTAEKIAFERNINPNNLLNITKNNVYNLFSKIKK